MRGFVGSRSTRGLLATAAALSLALTACGGDDEPASTSAAADAAPAQEVKCGLGNGEKASGEAIKLGAIATKMPGVDLSQAPQLAKAFFDCVNDNGGINGRPVDYEFKVEKTDPQSVAALAARLVEDDGVLGLVGSSSLLDCTVNHPFYEKQGFYPIVAGSPKECFSTPNIAPVNVGAYYSTIGAAQWAIEKGAKSLAVVTGQGPGLAYNNSGAVQLAEQKGLKAKSLQDPVPVTDGAAAALKYVQTAGDGGAVILDFPASEALKVLQGAQQQGLIDKVTWACASPCNDDSLAEALGSEWDGKLGINAELNLTSAAGEDADLYRAVNQKYAPDVPTGSFGQMGFLAAKIATDALLNVKGELTANSVNEAFRDTAGFESDMLCKPWYFGTGEQHVPNNTDFTVVPRDGKFAVEQKCLEIAALPGNPLAEIRKAEQGGA